MYRRHQLGGPCRLEQIIVATKDTGFELEPVSGQDKRVDTGRHRFVSEVETIAVRQIDIGHEEIEGLLTKQYASHLQALG